MKNLFLAYREKFFLGIVVTASIFSLIGLWGSYYIFAVLLLLACLLYKLFYYSNIEIFFNAFLHACEGLKKGDFESRIILPKIDKNIKIYVDKFNNIIDVCDAFVRESSLAMKAVEEERFYRKIRPEGFLGSYTIALNRINHSINVIDEKTNQERMLKTSIDNINSAIAVGNLDIYIPIEGFSESYLPLINGLNDLVVIISKPVKESIEVLTMIANGDFSRSMEGDYQGAFKELQMAFERTRSDLSDMIKKIDSISGSVNDSSQRIVRSAGEISEKAETQASALQQTAASVEELASTVRQNSQNATESQKLAQNAQELAMITHSAMDETVVSIKSIKTSADKIQGIIEFLDEISFQTNILALNATIEAAQAGVAGRGFAVVANEVRNLAKKSAEASNEMKQLLFDSHNEIHQGVNLILKTNESLNEIFDSIKTVAGMITDIAAASVEQASGIEQINTAISQLDQVTQLNSAAANENYSSTESLNNNAKNLKQIVGRFKLKN